MTAFVESCVLTAAGSAAAAERRARGRPRAHRLLKMLEGKRNILITTHTHPDPDALGSSLGLANLLTRKLKDAEITVSVKGEIAGGVNEAFTRYTNLKLAPWSDQDVIDGRYDAIILLDTQPIFAYSPLPPGVTPTAVIDHHRAPGRRPKCPFCDIRTDVGATSSIIFSYFMELEIPITPDLAASLLYAIESDLAGAAGTPTELDNIALSSLTLLANTRKLYQMRYVDLPQNYYVSTFEALSSAMYYENVVIAHLGEIDSLEKPALMADFLLRFDKVQWAMVTAIHEKRLVLSLRSSDKERSAGEVMRKLVRGLGAGGGHKSKAGGFVQLENGTPAEIERLRNKLRQRVLAALNIKGARGQRLVPPQDGAPPTSSPGA
jgi:nanoRNase/pAp phosphatase (c-di-AMP/oligoRNAs hydrolase)